MHSVSLQQLFLISVIAICNQDLRVRISHPLNNLKPQPQSCSFAALNSNLKLYKAASKRESYTSNLP
jgi:hypothetical protein